MLKPLAFPKLATAGLLLVTFAGPGLGQPTQRQPDVPFVPTPKEVVAAMLKLGGVKSGDVIYDLGSGDGRIVIAAAEQFHTRGVGIDINPERIQEATENARKAGVNNLVQFRQADLFSTDISEATVVTLYLLPSVNLKLRPKLLHDLKPGTRIVSHSFDMGDWKPERQENIEGRMIYLWTVPDHTASRSK
jgi:SAM-dependent methyltransferase